MSAPLVLALQPSAISYLYRHHLALVLCWHAMRHMIWLSFWGFLYAIGFVTRYRSRRAGYFHWDIDFLRLHAPSCLCTRAALQGRIGRASPLRRQRQLHHTFPPERGAADIVISVSQRRGMAAMKHVILDSRLSLLERFVVTAKFPNAAACLMSDWA